MKNLWCFSCGKIHRPGQYTYTQREFKLESNRRCKSCVGAGRKVKRWELDEQGELVLEGGKPVDVDEVDQQADQQVDQQADQQVDQQTDQ